MPLKTDYKDAIPPSTGRVYRPTYNADNTITLEDVTEYEQAGDAFGAAAVNAITVQVNQVAAPGIIEIYAGSTAPAGWLICNGANVSRATYAALFAIIHTTYGAGDGSTTFALPDMRGRVGVGIGASGVTTLGQTGGEQTHTLGISEIPSHYHGLPINYGSGGGSVRGISAWSDSASVDYVYRSGTAGSGGAHNNMQPYLGVNYIIKT